MLISTASGSRLQAPWALLVLFCLACVLGGGGCVPRRQLAYLQPASGAADTVFAPPAPRYRLEPGDLLSIRFTGTDPASLAPFGPDNLAQSSGQTTPQAYYVTGYTVSDTGAIRLPLLGAFEARGRTLSELEADIQRALGGFVRQASVKVLLLSFKFTVLGEVRTPGTYYIYNERLTLPEALGYAGDLTDLADRRNIRILRREGGQLRVITLDLTRRSLLGSPYFYLQPNDVLYLEPIRSKADRLNLPALSIAVSGLTALIVILSLVVNRPR